MIKRVLIDAKMLFTILGLISLFPGLFFLYLVTNSEPTDTLYYFSTANGRNLHAYVVSMSLIILTFAILCLCFRRFLSYKKSCEALEIPAVWCGLILIVLLSVCVFLLYDLFLNNEDNLQDMLLNSRCGFRFQYLFYLSLVFTASLCKKVAQLAEITHCSLCMSL